VAGRRGPAESVHFCEPDEPISPMTAAVTIEGHAVVSDDDRIADAAGRMPRVLMNDADWRHFQARLDAATVTVLGRKGHEMHANPKRRTRLVVSSSAAGLERRDDAWWWNPAAIAWPEVVARLLPCGGRVSVPGGTDVFDLFLAIGYDEFHLTRVIGSEVGEGARPFRACDAGYTPESVLEGAGLELAEQRVLDPVGPVVLSVWSRPT
jgi:hypothetical protein